MIYPVKINAIIERRTNHAACYVLVERKLKIEERSEAMNLRCDFIETGDPDPSIPRKAAKRHDDSCSSPGANPMRA